MSLQEFRLGYNLLQESKPGTAPIILDIRTIAEFCQGHLCGATIIPTQLPPLSKREKQTLKEQLWYILAKQNASKTHPILVYCKKGVRANIAKQIIRSMGFRNVISLGGVADSPLKDVMFGKNRKLQVCNCGDDL